MHSFHRHDLLFLTPKARERICGQIRSDRGIHGDQMAEAFASGLIPAIIRRYAPCDHSDIGIGISFPLIVAGERLRFATAVTSAEIDEMISPYAVLGRPLDTTLPLLKALEKVKGLKLTRPGNLGVYGASALQVVTGLNYVHDKSDIDLIIREESIDVLRHAKEVLSALERQIGVAIDVEVILGSGNAVKLKELCSQQKTVLIKSILAVHVINKREAIGSLPVEYPANSGRVRE
jgi:phosphoribosyl-dephospho-CoA transferase